MILQYQRKDYLWTSWKRCIKPCYTNMESPVVSQAESECMINCISKSLETMEHFQAGFSKFAKN